EFIEISDGVTIRLGEINAETKDARDIFLERKGADGGKTIITARYGAISTTPEITSLLLRLQEGRQVIVNALGDRIQALDFESFDLEVDLPAIGVFRERGTDEREATIGEILRYLASEPPSAELYDEYRAGLQWRILHPLTFLILPILAVAMGVTGRRRASNLKPVVGVAILIVYHEVLEEWAKVAASKGELSPYVSMWGVFFLFVLISGFLYSGSIDQARSTKVMSRRSEHTVRIAAPTADAAE
ncbi:MAG: LptF/LptG family permease, partial [Oricola sp.]|nr:LptF/LptG family permease [Oricola sp.]